MLDCSPATFMDPISIQQSSLPGLVKVQTNSRLSMNSLGNFLARKLKTSVKGSYSVGFIRTSYDFRNMMARNKHPIFKKRTSRQVRNSGRLIVPLRRAKNDWDDRIGVIRGFLSDQLAVRARSAATPDRLPRANYWLRRFHKAITNTPCPPCMRLKNGKSGFVTQHRFNPRDVYRDKAVLKDVKACLC